MIRFRAFNIVESWINSESTLIINTQLNYLIIWTELILKIKRYNIGRLQLTRYKGSVYVCKINGSSIIYTSR